MNTAWLFVPAMRELGYHEEAERIVRSLEGPSSATVSASTTTRSPGVARAPQGSGFATLLSIFSHSPRSKQANRPRRSG